MLEEKAGDARCAIDIKDDTMKVKFTEISKVGAANVKGLVGRRLGVHQLGGDE